MPRRARLNAFERSYRNYKRLHQEYKEKGYSIEEAFTKEQYKQKIYVPAQRMGSTKNVSLLTVKEQVAYTYSAARRVTKKLNEIRKAEIDLLNEGRDKKINYHPQKVRDLIGLNIDIEQQYVPYTIEKKRKDGTVVSTSGWRMQTKKEAVYNYLREHDVDTTEYYGY